MGLSIVGPHVAVEANAGPKESPANYARELRTGGNGGLLSGFPCGSL